MNRELGRFFRTFVRDNHKGWANYTKIIQQIINETYHETTEFTPLELHMNKKPERVWKRWFTRDMQPEEKPYEEKIFLANDRMHKKGRRNAKRHDNKKERLFVTFEVGDEVLVKANNVSDLAEREIAKFFAIYEGPYVIQRRIGETSYFLIDQETQNERGRFHVSDLKKYLRQEEID